MTNPDWFILIYKTADADAQEALAHGLRSLGGLTVHTDRNNGEHFVVIESTRPIEAITLHDLVMTFDSHAELIDTHRAPTDAEDISGGDELTQPA